MRFINKLGEFIESGELEITREETLLFWGFVVLSSILSPVTDNDLITITLFIGLMLSSLNIIVKAIKGYKNYYKYKLSKKRIEDLFTINVENSNCLEYFSNYSLLGTIKIKKKVNPSFLIF